MEYYYWKPVLCGILFTAVISVNGRPSEKNIESLEGDKTDGVQICFRESKWSLEFSSLGSSNVENENANKDTSNVASAFKKLFYNVSHGGLNVPVQVVYDAPDYYVKELLQKSRSHYNSNLSTENERSGAAENAQMSLAWRDIHNVNLSRERNSKHRNLTNTSLVQDQPGGNKENLEHYFFTNVDELAADEPVSIDLKSINRTKNPFAFIINNRPEYIQRVNSSTNKKVPILLQLFAPTKNEYNDTIIERIDNKYLIPILEKLIANRHRPNIASTAVNEIALPTSTIRPHKPNIIADYYPVKNIAPSYYHNYHNRPAPYPVDGGSYDMLPMHFHTYHPYYPYDYYRHWAPPFSNYLPPDAWPPRDPYFFRDMIDYRSSIDTCQHSRMARNFNGDREEEDEKDEMEQQTEPNFEDGKRRYDDSPTIEYVDHVRAKRNKHSKKEEFRVARPSIFGNKIKKEEPPENNNRASDVGPQISKLIVRRGGVAIAGAGGIATAGSGGTAIVGPGGTAYTTPASSGGVAMVGPGGKVVNLPDIPSVLYGRTASITATGAGHATFTNRHGEVFTTNDNTGGVALVNPSGNLLGVSDDQNAENENNISATGNAKEVHLPAGARLLTTGPIIYYNPIYPTNHLR